MVLPEKMIRTDNLRPRVGQFAGLLGSRWDPWFLEAAAWCHHGWGARPASDPQTPDNLAATIYQALGIPRSAVWRDTGERPHAFYTGEPVRVLFA